MVLGGGDRWWIWITLSLTQKVELDSDFSRHV